jgi:D-sedoheptulose 7-phosphate isomerase
MTELRERRDRTADAVARQLEDHLAAVAAARTLLPAVSVVAGEICARLARGGIVYGFGNGGSAADAQHLVAELVGRYRRERRPLPAVALSVDPSVTSCIGNDYDFAEVFARQVTALAKPDDVVVGFTTSGRSPNVVAGLAAARRRGALTVLFTGAAPGPAGAHADCALSVPSTTTARIQELHVLLLHLVSEHIDRWATGEAH